MAHTILNSCFINLVAKVCPSRTTLLEVTSLQYTFRHGYKHYKPEFKKHRCLKNQLNPMYTNEAELPKHGPNSMHYNFRLHGRYWNEPRTVSSHTFSLIDPYDPIKDEEQSWLNPKGALEKLKTRRKNKKAIRDIQSFDEHFDIEDFTDECDEIYKKANESIAAKDLDKMLDYLTPPAYHLAVESTRNKRIHWNFLRTIDPPFPLRVRAVVPQNTSDESFAQITVRLHTQQTLAVYDRFGRLMMGSEILAKDVLEIVVFEKRISHAYGMWRIHEKIPVPGGLTARTQLPRTKLCEVIEVETEEQQQEVETAVDVSASTQTPPLELKEEVYVKQN